METLSESQTPDRPTDHARERVPWGTPSPLHTTVKKRKEIKRGHCRFQRISRPHNSHLK